MQSMGSPGCLTRIVVGQCQVEVAELAAAIGRIQLELRDVPAAQREYIAKALLGLAVTKMTQ